MPTTIEIKLTGENKKFDTTNREVAKEDNGKSIKQTLWEKAQAEDAKKGKYNIDGKIGKTEQGTIGDCWLLTGVNSLSYSKTGQNALSKSIKNNKNGTYTVNFKGVGKSYTINESQMKEAQKSEKYSTGDPDMLLIELATEALLKEIRSGKVKLDEDVPELLHDGDFDIANNPLDAGPTADVLYLFTGKEDKFETRAHFLDLLGLNNSIDKALNKLSDDFWATVGFDTKKDGTNAVVKDINGKNVELVSGHAWSIKSVDDENITLVNPWDSNIKSTIAKDDVLPYMGHISYCDFKA